MERHRQQTKANDCFQGIVDSAAPCMPRFEGTTYGAGQRRSTLKTRRIRIIHSVIPLLLLFAGRSTAAVPTNGLVAAYNFSGNAQDSGPNGINGTVHSAVLTTDRFGNVNCAYVFNGTNAYIEIPDNDVFSVPTTGDFSISVWMRPDVLQFPKNESGYVHWMGKGTSSGSTGNQEWAFRMYNYVLTNAPPPDDTRTNRTSFYLFNNIGGQGAGSYVQEPVAAGTWYHYVAVVSTPANAITWYKNGVKKDQDCFNCSPYFIIPQNSNAPVRVGTRNLTSYFQGAIDDIYFYNRVLTTNEIKSLYQDVPAPAPLILNVTPSCGGLSGGTPVIITGSNFVTGSTLSFGGAAAANVAVLNSNTVTAIAPANSAGEKIVQITNWDGKYGALTNGFSYAAPPSPDNSGPVCDGQTLNLFANTNAPSYSWTGPNGFTSSLQNPSITNATAAEAGTYNLTLTCESVTGSTTVAILTPPVFTGLGAAIPAVEGATLTWSAASSNAVAYQIFEATSSGGQDFGMPTFSTNSLSASIAPLFPGSNAPTTYFFVVRAVDGCGNTDTNTIEKFIQPLLDPTKDQDGDGMPNAFEQAYGLNPFSGLDSSLDSDGDGLNNLQEFLAGTDPTNSASAFRITAAARSNDDIVVFWMTGIGKTNALECSIGDLNAGYSSNFSTIFLVTNTTSSITNYIDTGAASTMTLRFYRVRLVP